MTLPQADVYKQDTLAGHFIRTEQGLRFTYAETYLAGANAPVATTLPLREEPYETYAGALPPFFTGLLPEGRRLTALRNSLKVSRDDELSLLLAIGEDTVGDVRVVPHGKILEETSQPVSALPNTLDFSALPFRELLSISGFTDQAALPGVQEKVSGKMLTIPLRQANDFYILKLNPPEYPHVVENEAFFLKHAGKLKARNGVVQTQLVHDAQGESGLLIRRFDREVSSEGRLLRLAVEDACQILNRYPADKYNLSALTVAEALTKLSQTSLLSAQEIVRQLVFAWLTGNGDLHAKNFSLVSSDSAHWKLSPTYDIPSTAPYGDRSMALSILGKKQGISRKTFIEFGQKLNIREPAIQRLIDRALSDTTSLIEDAQNLPFDSHRKKNLMKVLKDRRRSLQG